MEFKTGKCPKCGNHNLILPSNNPLVPSVCNYCISSNLDYNNIEHGDFFCRTYNLPFRPEVWTKFIKLYGKDIYKEYISTIYDENIENLYHTTTTKDLWKELNNEWELIQMHEQLISKIEPIKEGFLLRNRIKWGMNYSFEELIRLEDLFVHTISSNEATNSMQVDAIKKACKMSIELDRAILARDVKEINELSKAYQNFIKTAQIDQIITASSEDVISNVAELVDFVEKSGFKFNYYDNVNRDIVDRSLEIMKNYNKRLVTDATGLNIIFESINNAVKRENEEKANIEAYDQVPLEDLYEKEIAKSNEEFDTELESEEFEEFSDTDFDGGDPDEEDYAF